MKTGVYIFTNLIDTKIYIGSALTNIYKRRNQHLSLLRLGKHPNPHFQSAFNIVGEENFHWQVLEFYEPEFCISMEQYWVNLTGAKNPNIGYNINDPVNVRYGLKHTEESKYKMMISQLKYRRKGEEITEEIIKEHLERKNKPNKTKEEISNIYKGEKNPFYGKTHTKEALDKMKVTNGWVKNYKRVAKCDLEGNIIKEYNSLKEAKLDNNITSSGGIGAALKYPHKTHKGFKWIYLPELPKSEEFKSNPKLYDKYSGR